MEKGRAVFYDGEIPWKTDRSLLYGSIHHVVCVTPIGRWKKIDVFDLFRNEKKLREEETPMNKFVEWEAASFSSLFLPLWQKERIEGEKWRLWKLKDPTGYFVMSWGQLPKLGTRFKLLFPACSMSPGKNSWNTHMGGRGARFSLLSSWVHLSITFRGRLKSH